MIAAPPEHPSGSGSREPGSTTPSRVGTLANGLTLLRLVAAPLAAIAIFRGNHETALLLFTFAVATDLADGPVARWRGESSALGGFFDHATDATFVALGLLACAARELVPVALPILIATAFLQYTLESRALRGQVLRASGLGRWNGVAYFVLLGVPVVRDGLGIGWPTDGVVLFLGWTLVSSTVVSMGLRARAWFEIRRAGGG